MESTRTNPASRCPGCLRRADGATNARSGGSPKPGDISVCAYCSTPCTFNDDLTLRALHADEYDALPDRVRMQVELYRKTVRQMIAGKGKP